MTDCEQPTATEVAKASGIYGNSTLTLEDWQGHMVQWLTKVSSDCLEKWTDAVRLEEGNYISIAQREGQQERVQELQRNHPVVYPGKALAITLLARIKTNMMPKQSSFTPNRSTIDRIIMLNALLHTRTEFNKPLWTAYVDLKSAFNSVNSGFSFFSSASQTRWLNS